MLKNKPLCHYTPEEYDVYCEEVLSTFKLRNPYGGTSTRGRWARCKESAYLIGKKLLPWLKRLQLKSVTPDNYDMKINGKN